MKKIGAIGVGSRIGKIAGDMVKTGKIELVAVADINWDNAKKNISKWKEWMVDYSDSYIESIHFYKDYHDMLKNEKLDGILIGTRCSLHAEICADLLSYGIPIFAEKPVAINEEQLQILRDALEKNPSMDDLCVVSFPLRNTNLVQYAKKLIDSGVIGKVEHVQAVNNVPYGRVYYHGWYRDENETGGLWLQKATHDFDYINYILGLRPVYICAMSSKQIFKGDKPAGLTCEVCPEKETCPESPENIKKNTNDLSYGNFCCFATDTGNHDSGTAIIQYDSGMHVVYSQNFFARLKAAKRGARFIGYKGTIEFDWESKEVRVFMHDELRNEVSSFEAIGSHGGGDNALVNNFYDVMCGKDVSKTPLKEGILSAQICLKAREACKTHTYQQIDF